VDVQRACILLHQGDLVLVDAAVDQRHHRQHAHGLHAVLLVTGHGARQGIRRARREVCRYAGRQAEHDPGGPVDRAAVGVADPFGAVGEGDVKHGAQDRPRLRDRGDSRTEGKDGHAHEEGAPTTEYVAEATAGDDQHAEPERVRVHRAFHQPGICPSVAVRKKGSHQISIEAVQVEARKGLGVLSHHARSGRGNLPGGRLNEALGELGPGTFGHAFWEHFKSNRFAFPGDPNGLAEGFTTRHDTSHVLSGYTTSPQGELLVSTFIGAMHPDHPMSAEVLPALFSYHLGVAMNDIAQVERYAFEPQKFWTAWDRGAATSVDVFDPAWDFWAAAQSPLEELRRAHNVVPVDPALLA
jgi:hypothetical protein